jgi:hypothetical protein
LPSDVYLLKVGARDPRELLAAVVAWRDWLADEGATLSGSMGSAAMSLLRARLVRPWWTRTGETPPVYWTLGGRQELGRHGAGHFRGTIRQYDLPAAYARTLAETPYGGRWRRSSTRARRGEWTSSGLPVFVRARVRLADDVGYGPGLQWPPLPVMPRGVHRQPADAFVALTLVTWYGSGRRQGVWSAPELEAALGSGACELDQVLDVWTHYPEAGGARARYPLAGWWQAIERGRAMPGLAGLLGKQTGNALWGQLSINPHGSRRIYVYRRGPGGRWRMVPEKLPKQKPAGRKRAIAPDLAEYVAGSVRSRLYLGMVEAGDRLLSVHTDGGWFDCSDGWTGPEGWRVKTETRQLRLLNPQMLAWSRRGGWRYVCSGSVDAKATFEQAWAEHLARPADRRTPLELARAG